MIKQKQKQKSNYMFFLLQMQVVVKNIVKHLSYHWLWLSSQISTKLLSVLGEIWHVKIAIAISHSIFLRFILFLKCNEIGFDKYLFKIWINEFGSMNLNQWMWIPNELFVLSWIWIMKHEAWTFKYWIH